MFRPAVYVDSSIAWCPCVPVYRTPRPPLLVGPDWYNHVPLRGLIRLHEGNLQYIIESGIAIGATEFSKHPATDLTSWKIFAGPDPSHQKFLIIFPNILYNIFLKQNVTIQVKGKPQKSSSTSGPNPKRGWG